MGDRLEHNVVILSVAKDEQEATFGMGLLSRFRMTLDVPHRQLLLEPATDYGDRCRLPGLPGIWAARTRNQYTVEEVLPNSTAAKAGIQLGDRILSIDGTIPTLLPERTISYVLDGIAGTQADLWVARKDNSQLHIRYVRQSLFAMASGRDFGTGIATTITDSGKMLVAGLMHHSPAGEAGIQVGDAIVSIAGLPVTTTPMAQLKGELKKPVGTIIVLKLLHHGDSKPYEVKLTVRKLFRVTLSRDHRDNQVGLS